jgi:hypothetical protein
VEKRLACDRPQEPMQAAHPRDGPSDTQIDAMIRAIQEPL